MLKKILKGVSATMVFFMLSGVFAGCGKTEKKEDAKPAQQATATAAQGSASVYPLKSNVTLKYWVMLHTNVSSIVKSYNELPFFKELEKRVGVKIEFIHPPVGQEKEAFNIMVASGDLPDILEYRWLDQYPGGPENAVNNGVIIKLNDTIDKYSPNYKAFLKENPAVNKEAKADNGDYYLYPFVRKTKLLQTTSGNIIRKDWLDELKLPVPETLDEWYTMLKAFRDQKGATAPLTVRAEAGISQIREIMTTPFNTKFDFYVVDGKAKWGPYEDNFKEFLKTMAQWYKEGILDKNFGTNDKKALDTNMLTGKSGATYGAGGQNLGVWITTARAKDPKYTLTAAKGIVMKKGDKPLVGSTSNNLPVEGHCAITKTSKNVEAAARLLDYGYSKEGNIFYNYGVEGQSYKMVDGKPTYTELVMKNPNKLTVAQALTSNSRANTHGPFAQEDNYLLQYYELPEQKEALLKYFGDHDYSKTQLPRVSYTPAESSELAKIRNEIETYSNEFMLKAIMGTESVDNFGTFKDRLKQMKIDRALEIVQAAVDRYNKR